MQSKTLLPVVKRGVALLDELLLEYAGPIGRELSEDEFERWVVLGKTRPSDLRHYADQLGGQLDDPVQKKQFLEKANGLLLKLQTGFIQSERK
jgi:hypothetical protein